MSRRTLWGSLALVVAVLTGASVLSTGALPAWAEAVMTAIVALPALAATLPGWAAPAIGAALGLVLALVVWWRRQVSAATPPEHGQQFDRVLDAAMAQSGDPRRYQVTRLAGSGSSLGRISRETRLARDAVRTVIGSR